MKVKSLTIFSKYFKKKEEVQATDVFLYFLRNKQHASRMRQNTFIRLQSRHKQIFSQNEAIEKYIRIKMRICLFSKSRYII